MLIVEVKVVKNPFEVENPSIIKLDKFKQIKTGLNIIEVKTYKS